MCHVGHVRNRQGTIIHFADVAPRSRSKISSSRYVCLKFMLPNLYGLTELTVPPTVSLTRLKRAEKHELIATRPRRPRPRPTPRRSPPKSPNPKPKPSLRPPEGGSGFVGIVKKVRQQVVSVREMFQRAEDSEVCYSRCSVPAIFSARWRRYLISWRDLFLPLFRPNIRLIVGATGPTAKPIIGARCAMKWLILETAT